MIECPFKTPLKVIETDGSIVDAENEMILKVLYSHKTFDLQVQQLHYAAKAINCHERYEAVIKSELEGMRKMVAANENDPQMRPFAQVLKGKIALYREALKEAEK